MSKSERKGLSRRDCRKKKRGKESRRAFISTFPPRPLHNGHDSFWPPYHLVSRTSALTVSSHLSLVLKEFVPAALKEDLWTRRFDASPFATFRPSFSLPPAIGGSLRSPMRRLVFDGGLGGRAAVCRLSLLLATFQLSRVVFVRKAPSTFPLDLSLSVRVELLPRKHQSDPSKKKRQKGGASWNRSEVPDSRVSRSLHLAISFRCWESQKGQILKE